ncbi:MAG TPA: hypothetical protein VHG89_11200 [Verrucomicrobiae bacterium]|nr:hypothetical protein [Verrucomicrobiae bacterium]
MTREEAKLILQVCRPSDAAAGDAFFCEALTLAKTDSELAAWFAEQQKFDILISSGLQKVNAPAQLKAKILARKPETEPVISPISIWWQNLFSWQSPIAWTAAIILVVVLFAMIKPATRGLPFAVFSKQMVDEAINNTNHVDMENSNMKQVAAWLGEHHGANNLILPAALSGKTGLMGCRVLDWHGQKVSMLCYYLNNSAHMDLFVVSTAGFRDAPPVDKPQFVQNGETPTASWSHGGMVYLLIGHDDEATLEKVLQPQLSARLKYDSLSL